MDRLLKYLLAAALCTSTLMGGKVQCPKHSMILEGTKPGMMGSTYHEHLEMHQIAGVGGYDGKWQVDLFRQVVTYPWVLNPPVHTDVKVDFRQGIWMQCKADTIGNRLVSNCTGGNMTLDVYKNRIGLHSTNIWIGKITGKNVSLKFHKENQYEPTITGTIKEFAKGELDITVTAPTEEKFVYSDAAPGVLEIELTAKVTPQQYEADVVWEIPDIGNSQKTVNPASGKGAHVTVRYKGLPKHNMDFGEKEFVARVDTGVCKASDSRKVRVFFPRDARNSPESSLPNWFYYWSQTPARKGPATYGDPLGYCQSTGTRADNLLGYYRSKYLEDHYYICDLTNLGPRFPFNTVKYQGDHFVSLHVEGIDTFAAACWHENAHYTHFRNWWFAHRAVHPFDPVEDFNKNSIKDSVESVLDHDNDLIPDSLEPALGFDPSKKYSFPVNVDDEEIDTWFEESKWQIGSADKEDWAKPGKQWP